MLNKLKKFLILILVIPISLCFVSCKDDNNNNNNVNKPSTPPEPVEETFQVNVSYNFPEKFSFLKEDISEKVNTTETYQIPEIENDYSEYFLGWFEETSNEEFTADEILGSKGDVVSIYAKWSNDFVRFFELGNLTYETDENTKLATVSGYDGESETVVIPQAIVVDSETYAVTSIKQNAFLNSSIKSIVTYAEKLSVGDSAFSGSTLNSIDFSIIDSIGSSSFENTKISNISSFGSLLESIGSSAFKNCENLERVDFSNCGTTFNQLSDSIFEGCNNLVSVTLNSNIQEIGNYAFKNCISLETIDLSYSNLTTLGSYVFDGCNNLESMIIPENITTIGLHIFDNCENLIKLSVSMLEYKIMGEDCFTKFYGGLETVLKEVEIIGENVTAIKQGYFANYSALETLIMNDSITNVENAFENAINLEKITFSSNIDPMTFDIKVFSDTAWFNNLSDLFVLNKTVIYAPSTIGEIVEIPEGTEYIAKSVFMNSNITLVNIPASLKGIAQSAFYRCTSLQEIIFAENSQLTEIGIRAFYGCSSLVSINLNNCENLLTISSDAFYNVGSINEFFIPKSVTSIANAFSGSSIESFVVADENANYISVDGVLFEKNSNGDPETIISYPTTFDSAYYSLPETVTKIATGAFNSTHYNLKYVKVTSTSLAISSLAFNASNIIYILSETRNITNTGYNQSLGIIYMLQEGDEYEISSENDESLGVNILINQLPIANAKLYYANFVYDQQEYWFLLNLSVVNNGTDEEPDYAINIDSLTDISSYFN